MATLSTIKTTAVNVTRDSCQLYMKATIMEAIIVALNSTKTPNRSEIPICRVLLTVVMVVVAYPEGIESRTCTDCENKAET